MSNRNAPVMGGGIGLFSALGLIFITLKLCGVIDWGWFFVTMPLWVCPALALALLVLAVLGCVWFFAVLMIVTIIHETLTLMRGKHGE